MAEDVVIKNSKIHDNGVFADRDFKKGEIVLRWDTSVILTKDQVKKLPETEKRYVSFLDGKYVLMQSPERYVNHSCEANTTAKKHCDVAIRDIKKGEEITANYSEECLPDMRMKCNCGSKNCRGIIISYSKKGHKED